MGEKVEIVLLKGGPDDGRYHRVASWANRLTLHALSEAAAVYERDHTGFCCFRYVQNKLLEENSVDEIIAILEQSNAPQQIKTEALSLAFKVAVPLAFSQAGSSAGGEFQQILIELLKVLLPILLKLLLPS